MEEKEIVKYPYCIEYILVGSQQSPVMRLPKEIGLVTEFLYSDVRGPLGKTLFLEQMNRVLHGEVTSAEMAGNVFRTEITKDTTRIVDTLSEDECIYVSIETEELKKLILIWCKLIQQERVLR